LGINQSFYCVTFALEVVSPVRGIFITIGQIANASIFVIGYTDTESELPDNTISTSFGGWTGRANSTSRTATARLSTSGKAAAANESMDCDSVCRVQDERMQPS
jgi:hypothetical protein